VSEANLANPTIIIETVFLRLFALIFFPITEGKNFSIECTSQEMLRLENNPFITFSQIKDNPE